MLFSTLSTSLVGFAALAAAGMCFSLDALDFSNISAPQLLSRNEQDLAAREYVQPFERGLTWTRSQNRKNNDQNQNNQNNRNNNDKIEITQLVAVQLTEQQRGREVQFTEIVVENLQIIDQTKQNKDNIRKNHFRNRNNKVVCLSYLNVFPMLTAQNTIVVIVTEIIDNRDSNNRNKRYCVHQVHSNENILEQVVVVVSDRSTMTINDNSGRNNRRQAAATGVPIPTVVNFDPSADVSANNNTMILPSGLPAPSFKNANQAEDPASIILDGTDAFVDFTN